MKRLSNYISILWLFSLILSLAVPEVSFSKEQAVKELNCDDNPSDRSEELLTLSTSTEAILSFFQFDANSNFLLDPKLFLVLKIERANPDFEIRDFSILIWKRIFTTIIQVHGP